MAKHLAFIVSGGRTGTAFLGDLLSQAIADCHSEHEPDVFYGLDSQSLGRVRRFGAWQMLVGRALGLTGVRVLGTRYLTGKASLSATVERLRVQRAPYHRSVDAGLLIESYWAWWMLAEHLDTIFPGCKTIGIVRDPRHWIESYRRHFTNRRHGQLAHILPPGQITATSVGDREWGPQWGRLGRVGQLAWLWQFTNGHIAAAEDRGKATVFRFEDIFDPTSASLHSLCQKTAAFPSSDYQVSDPSALLAQKRNASGAPGEAWQEWSREERELVNELCGPLMARYDYAPL